MPDLGIGACTVYHSRFIIGFINTYQRGIIQNGAVTKGHPQIYDGQNKGPVFRFVIPVDLIKSQHGKDGHVHESVVTAQKGVNNITDDNGREQIGNQDNNLADTLEKLLFYTVKCNRCKYPHKIAKENKGQIVQDGISEKQERVVGAE